MQDFVTNFDEPTGSQGYDRPKSCIKQKVNVSRSPSSFVSRKTPLIPNFNSRASFVMDKSCNCLKPGLFFGLQRCSGEERPFPWRQVRHGRVRQRLGALLSPCQLLEARRHQEQVVQGERFVEMELTE